MNNTLRYVIYCRKSTDSEDRQVQSLETQEKRVMEIVSRDNLNVVATFKESMSAKASGRPLFNQAMRLIKSGKADAIICYKLDRLARNFIDGGDIIDCLQRSVIKEIKTSESRFLPTDNVIPIAVEFGSANQYVKDLSFVVRGGNITKLSNGGWPGNAPFGYLNDKAEKTIIVDTVRAPYVRRSFDLYANYNKSYSEIADILYSEGLRTKSGKKVLKSSIQRIITSKFYVGIMERDGKLYPGAHTPIVSKELFDKAQYVAEGKSRPRPQTRFFALRGLLSCENCGCAITATVKRGHDYYYCTDGKKVCTEHTSYMRETYLYEKVEKVLDDLVFDSEWIELVYQASVEKSKGKTDEVDKVSEGLQNRLKSLTEQEDKLLGVYLEGNISKEKYEEKLLVIKNEKVEVSFHKDKEKTNNPTVTLEQIKSIFLDGIKRRNEFFDAGKEKKKEILESVLWNISLKGKEIVTTQYKSEYMLLANSPKNLTISQGLASSGS